MAYYNRKVCMECSRKKKGGNRQRQKIEEGLMLFPFTELVWALNSHSAA